MTKSSPSDVIVIGAGMVGLVCLKYLRDLGLNALIVEKESNVGGLWRKLPSWQDIQTPKEDWAINDIPIDGVKQPDILKNIEAWCSIYKLEDFIKFNKEVVSVNHAHSLWTVRTTSGQYDSRYLIVASGLHNKPKIPDVPRDDPKIPEVHSSDIREISEIDVKSLAVIGGGASAYDIIEQAIERKVPEIHWVVGTPCWMTPSSKPKHEKYSLRHLAWNLMLSKSKKRINSRLREFYDRSYKYFEIEPIKPKEPLDFWDKIVVNGRPKLIKNLKRIKRYDGHMTSLSGKKVFVGEKQFSCDKVVYATGFDLDLNFLKLDALRSVCDRKTLQSRCGSLVKSLDYPNLFFMGPTVLDTNSTTPFYAATLAKSVATHIAGKIYIPDRRVDGLIPHWKLVEFLSEFDHYNYPRFLWRLKYLFLAWSYRRHNKRQIHV